VIARVLVPLLVLARLAAAEPVKATVAIIIDPKDRDAFKAADALTAHLRTFAGRKAERFSPKGNDKAWRAAKREAACTPLQLACAVKLGGLLGVDFIVTGEVETRAQRRVVVVAMVHVAKGLRVRSLRDTVTTSFDTRKWAQRIYERVVGSETGELTIVTNGKGGDVLLDGELVAALYEGKARITNVAVGAHALVIEARGFRPLEIEVVVDGATTENVLLDPLP
jgi:hypothetical protein